MRTPSTHIRPFRRLFMACAALAVAGLLTAAPPGAGAGDKDKKKDKKNEPAKDGPKIAYSLGPAGQFALQLIGPKGERHAINYEDDGIANTVVFVSVDGRKYVFGAPADGKFPDGYHGGKWEKRAEPLAKGRLGHRFIWLAGETLRVTQTLEIVKSKGGALDTCLLRYTIENRDKEAHKIGLRVVVDTLVGENDGHPFALPGKKELVTTSADLKGKDVPNYIKAQERADAKKPGVVAYFTLRAKGDLIGPDRVSLTRFPPKESIAADLFKWSLPVRNIKLDAKDPGDSAVVLYWDPREVRAGGHVDFGFAYGGGMLPLGKAKGKEKKAAP